MILNSKTSTLIHIRSTPKLNPVKLLQHSNNDCIGDRPNPASKRPFCEREGFEACERQNDQKQFSPESDSDPIRSAKCSLSLTQVMTRYYRFAQFVVMNQHDYGSMRIHFLVIFFCCALLRKFYICYVGRCRFCIRILRTSSFDLIQLFFDAQYI